MAIVLTPGDPTGIGFEITLKALNQDWDVPIVVVADPNWLSFHAAALKIPFSMQLVDSTENLKAHKKGTYHIAAVSGGENIPTLGTPDKCYGSYVHETLEKAFCLVGEQTQEKNAWVTGPIHKGIIFDAGFDFNGHTDYLQKKSGVDHVVMMLCNDGSLDAPEKLRVALSTCHVPIKEVSKRLTTSQFQKTLEITYQALKHQFGIQAPKMGICGLNPHAGEDGHLGTEDQTTLKPVIDQFNNQYASSVSDPLPADTLFAPFKRQQYDAIVAQYHDQGLAPIKALAFGELVNVTLGLPFIRTSVDHGIASDIAPLYKADAASLEHAMRLAIALKKPA